MKAISRMPLLEAESGEMDELFISLRFDNWSAPEANE
jgi:hypothetical protein